MKGHTYHNHYDKVWDSLAGGWDHWLAHKVTDHKALACCRTCGEAERDGECERHTPYCPYSMLPHFMVESSPGVYTKLCTLDVFRFRPFNFSMHRTFGADHVPPRPRSLFKEAAWRLTSTVTTTS